MAKCKWTVVVAATAQGGIGLRGALPWRLPGDMAFFKHITTKTKDPTKKNAVVMGRKTWDSIPEKFRPLAGRVNVILSKTQHSYEDKLDVHFVTSLQAAQDLLSQADEIETVHIIGGGTIYNEAFQTQLIDRVYLTFIHNYEGECDVFLPGPVENFGFHRVNSSEELPAQPKPENGFSYEFRVYER